MHSFPSFPLYCKDLDCAPRGQRRASGSLKLQLQVVSPKWVPGMELHVHVPYTPHVLRRTFFFFFWLSHSSWVTATFGLETCCCLLEILDLSFMKLWYGKMIWMRIFCDSPWKQLQPTVHHGRRGGGGGGGAWWGGAGVGRSLLSRHSGVSLSAKHLRTILVDLKVSLLLCHHTLGTLNIKTDILFSFS